MSKPIEVPKGWFVVELIEATRGILSINKITPYNT